jgi:hypothetical protein
MIYMYHSAYYYIIDIFRKNKGLEMNMRYNYARLKTCTITTARLAGGLLSAYKADGTVAPEGALKGRQPQRIFGQPLKRHQVTSCPSLPAHP